MTITLEDIKTEQARVAEMIATFERQAAEITELHFPEALISLQHGEHYAGLIVGKDGEPSYHLILLPGTAESVSWDDAKSWASKQRGALPNRREQALLYANLKDQFEGAWYWSNEQGAADSDYAWVQHFAYGYQYYGHKSNEYRARAVRRLSIID